MTHGGNAAGQGDAEAAPETKPATGPAIRVAILDDHRLVLDGITAHLQMRHPDISVVAAETTSIGLLSNPALPVDVVLLDLGLGDDMPVATRIRAILTTGARIVVMSRHTDALTVQSALRAGALAFVPKSEDAGEIATAIREAAAGRRYKPASVRPPSAVKSGEASPGLGEQELRALMLFASGRSVREVADHMSTTVETVKSYLKRARRKYRGVGVDLGNRVLLRRHAVENGWLSPE